MGFDPILLAVGFIVGALIGAVGIGGILLIPALAAFGRLGLHEAMATALFTFAFAPILAFVRLTMSGGQVVGAHQVAVLLLVVSLFAGIGQLLRFVRRGTALAPLGRSLAPVLFPWLALFVFINLRLASVLDLL